MITPASRPSAPTIHWEHWNLIDPGTLYGIVQLRQNVFTLEQGVTVADFDGRELDETTQIMWAQQGGTVIAHLRILVEADGTVHIGRVAVAAEHRRGGLGRRLMEAALEYCSQHLSGQLLEISAQAYLEGWYQSMGFVTTGPGYLEAGIEHVPMRWEGWPAEQTGPGNGSRG